mmetsp:Transcript_24547/g.61006  ORF Transcript_24547/g.61006 Transcript_24547/m.61006 type:complete len:265 (+) Transcript_24547:590-1384(+)
MSSFGRRFQQCVDGSHRRFLRADQRVARGEEAGQQLRAVKVDRDLPAAVSRDVRVRVEARGAAGRVLRRYRDVLPPGQRQADEHHACRRSRLVCVGQLRCRRRLRRRRLRAARVGRQGGGGNGARLGGGLRLRERSAIVVLATIHEGDVEGGGHVDAEAVRRTAACAQHLGAVGDTQVARDDGVKVACGGAVEDDARLRTLGAELGDHAEVALDKGDGQLVVHHRPALQPRVLLPQLGHQLARDGLGVGLRERPALRGRSALAS